MSDEKNYSQMRKEFQETYFKKLSPYLKNRDNERISKKNLITAIKIGLIAIAILYTIITMRISSNALVFIIAIFCIISMTLRKKFEKDIKLQIMPYVCKCFGNIKWTANEYVGNENLIFDSSLVPNCNTHNYDDIFKGCFKDVNFEIIEARFYETEHHTPHHRHYNKGIRCSTHLTKNNKKMVFSGVIVKLVMNKNFQGNTVITPNGSTSPSSKLKHTKLEDVEFEKKFDVFTDDEVEARYLITPSFMERLKNMQVAFNASKISCAFYDKYLLIGLHTKEDLFSIGDLNKPLNDDKQFFTMFEEILSIIKLIDHFKLDQKIGL